MRRWKWRDMYSGVVKVLVEWLSAIHCQVEGRVM